MKMKKATMNWFVVLGFAFVLVSTCRPQALPFAQKQQLVEKCAGDFDVVVRFYYNPLVNGEGTAHRPLILMPASSQDPRLGTRPAWILYVTLPDLRSALHALANKGLAWKESSSPMRLVVNAFDLSEPHHDSMEVSASCSYGSATAEVEAKQVCGVLSDVSGALSNQQARDSFLRYEKSVDCTPKGASTADRIRPR